MIPVIIEESPFSWGLISVIYNAIADINLQRYELKPIQCWARKQEMMC